VHNLENSLHDFTRIRVHVRIGVRAMVGFMLEICELRMDDIEIVQICADWQTVCNMPIMIVEIIEYRLLNEAQFNMTLSSNDFIM